MALSASVPALSARRLLARLAEVDRSDEALAALGWNDWPEPETRVPLAEQYALWEAAVTLTGDRALPMRVATEYDLATYDVLGFACATAPDLGAALERLDAYFRLWVTGEKAHFDRGTGTIVLEHALPASSGRQLAAESSLAKIVHATRLATAARFDPVGATFAHLAPATVEAHEAFFGTGLRFDAPRYSVTFASEDLARPLARADADFAAYFARVADDQLGARSGSVASAKVREVVAAMLPVVDEEQVGKRLGWSPRTLRRRLADDGTDFRSVVDDVRRQRAVAALAREGVDLDDLAEALGFSGKRSFYRAFKRWTGDTPGAFRRRATEPPPAL